jgi:transposase
LGSTTEEGILRGAEANQVTMLSLIGPEQMVPAHHPLRRVKVLADRVLKEMSGSFDEMYSDVGRPSVPPEHLLKATLLMAFFTVRSERLFCEQLGYNLLFRWFLGMSVVDEPFDHSTFSLNRKRLLEHDVAGEFFRRVVGHARRERLMSDEHFSVDGTLIEAWASLKSLRPKGKEWPKRDPPDDPGNPTVNFRGEKRSNETHESTTDPESRLARKGNNQPARLCYSEHVLMENRNGLIVDLEIAEANGTAERDQAIQLLDRAVPGTKRITLAGDRGYDTRGFVAECRDRRVTPHVAQNQSRRRSAIDRRTTRTSGYGVSQRIRKRIEEIFGWTKTIGGFRRTRFKGRERTQLLAYFVGAAYNLLRIAKLMPNTA